MYPAVSGFPKKPETGCIIVKTRQDKKQAAHAPNSRNRHGPHLHFRIVFLFEFPDLILIYFEHVVLSVVEEDPAGERHVVLRLSLKRYLIISKVRPLYNSVQHRGYKGIPTPSNAVSAVIVLALA